MVLNSVQVASGFQRALVLVCLRLLPGWPASLPTGGVPAVANGSIGLKSVNRRLAALWGMKALDVFAAVAWFATFDRFADTKT